MLIPASLLALLSIVGGFFGFAFGKLPPLESFLHDVGITKYEADLTSSFEITPETIWSVIGGLLGIGVAAFIYTKYSKQLRGHSIELLKNGFYINEIYWKVFAVPLIAFARFIASFVEPKFFDGMIKGATDVTQNAARWLQRMQSGQIRSYVAWMVVGAVLAMIYLVL
jgi:NADH-quinone oxidoreductase subunit L